MPASAASGTWSAQIRARHGNRVANPAGCGRRSRAAANSAAFAGSGPEGAAATGRASDRSASPGMQISEQASQVACAAIGAVPPGLAGRTRLRIGGDRDQQIDRARVAVIADVIDDKALRGRPFDLAGGEAGRQRPGDLGRQSGIAGIAPIDMPARLHLQMQRDPDGLAGRDRAGLGDEARLDRVFDRRRGRKPRPSGRRDAEPDHQGQHEPAGNAINRIGSRFPKYSRPEDGA